MCVAEQLQLVAKEVVLSLLDAIECESEFSSVPKPWLKQIHHLPLRRLKSSYSNLWFSFISSGFIRLWSILRLTVVNWGGLPFKFISIKVLLAKPTGRAFIGPTRRDLFLLLWQRETLFRHVIYDLASVIDPLQWSEMNWVVVLKLQSEIFNNKDHWSLHGRLS